MISSSSKIIKAEHVRIVKAEKDGKKRSESALSSPAARNTVPDTQEKTNGSEDSSKISQALLDESKKEAYDSGFKAGIAEGRNQALQELAQAFQAVELSVEGLKSARSDVWKQSEQAILKLAFMIAEKVIHREVSTDRTVVIDVVKHALGCIQEKDDMTIKLNPRDYDYIAETKPDFLSTQGLVESFVLERDDRIKPGGAVIATRYAEVDARLEEQLNNILESLITS